MSVAPEPARHWSPDRVRTRLLAAFLILLVAAVALTLVGWVGMRSTQNALTGFEQEVLPNIASALELAERTTQLAAIAPHLAASRTVESLQTNAGVFNSVLNDIRRRSRALTPAQGLRSTLDELLAGMDRDLSGLIELTRERQALETRLQQQMQHLEGLGNVLHARDRLGGVYDPAIAAVWSSMVRGATSDSAATLGRLQADVEALLLAATRREAFRGFDADFQATLTALAVGPDNLLDLRRNLREFERRTGVIILNTRTSADQLSEQVSRHVAYLRDTAAERSTAVRRAIRSGETGMLTLALVCLAVGAVAIRYVHRLVSQIETITAVMSRLAQGDTAQATPATHRQDELGALARAFEVFRDTLLAKQQLLIDLANQRELLEAVHNSMTDGLAVFDAQGRLLLWNPQMADVLARHASPPRVGVSMRELFAHCPPGTTWVAPGHMTPQALDSIRARHFASFEQIELQLPQAQVFDLRSRAMPGGGAVMLATDLTVRRAVETQLQHAQKLEMLGQLTGGVTHDFNNYLGTILGNLALLESRPGLDADSQVQLQRAHRAASRAAGLTRRLLAFARRQPLQAEYLSVDAMLEEMRDLIEYSAGPQVSVTLDLDARAVRVYLDRGQLENALLNIVINSSAAMPGGGRLTLGTRRLWGESPLVEIRVSDTGSGIPEHLQSKVFEPFFTTKSAGEGTGLGLSIVYGFVKQSGGDIDVHSRLGEGTRVSLTFPVARETDIDGAQALPAPAAAVLPPLRLLLVDDDDAFRATVVDMLHAAGVTVVAESACERALARLDTDTDFDLALSDICLGAGMDGIGFARAVAARGLNIPVGLMSGIAPEAFSSHPDWDPAIPFLQKPFSPQGLTQWLYLRYKHCGRS